MKPRLGWQSRWCILFPAVAGAVVVLLLATSPARAAGLLIADGGFGGVLVIEEHTVRATVNNGVAVTEVEQVFRNTEQRTVEALYTFPVPKGASVANFSMWINGKEMTGEVLEKARARQIYESYKTTRRDPGLLEQTDYRTFEMRIFPIGPGASQRVKIAYYQELDFDDAWATYVYPLATLTRREIKSQVAGKLSLTLEVKSEVPISAMESPSHGADFAIARHSDFHYRASLEASGGNLGRDVVLAYQTARPVTGVDMITSRHSGDDGYFLLTLTAGEELAEQAKGMDYVFVLDISGSMADDGKKELSHAAVEAFARELDQTDRFEVVTFNVEPGRLWGALRPPTPENRTQAATFVSSRPARGGTELHPAVKLAYQYADAERPLNIVILSDGLAEQPDRTQLVQLIKSAPANSRVFCIGFGNNVNRPLLEQVAQEAGGLAAFVSQGDNLERNAKAFRRKLLRPMATGLRIEFTGKKAYDLEPATLPNLYHGMPVRLYGRYRDAGPVDVAINASVNGKTLSKSLTIEFPKENADNPEIERMWAWHRVDRLLKEADKTGSRTPVIDEIVRLGEGYSIATEYTSFIVLENDAEYRRWAIERRNAVRVGRDQEKQENLRKQLETMRLEAVSQIGPVSGGENSLVARSPVPTAPLVTQGSAPAQVPASQPRHSRGWDLSLGGGGAIDPLSGGIALGLAALAALARLGRKRQEEDNG